MWQEHQAAAVNQPHPLRLPSPQISGDGGAVSEGEDGGVDREHSSNLQAGNEDILPEQEHYVGSPCIGGAEAPPPPMLPANFPMMMQRPPPPHLPPGPFMFSNSPYCYPMLPPHHMTMPPLMGFMPFMPPLIAPHLMPTPPSPIPDVPSREVHQQQDDSQPSSPYQMPVSMDVPSDNSHTAQGSENAPYPNLQVQQSEMVASAGMPLPPSAIPQPVLQQELLPGEHLATVEQNQLSLEQRVEDASAPSGETSVHQGRQEEEMQQRGLEERVGRTTQESKSVLPQVPPVSRDNNTSSEPQVKKSTSAPTMARTPGPPPSTVSSSSASRPHQSSDRSSALQQTAAQSAPSRQSRKVKSEKARTPGLPCRPATSVTQSPASSGAKELEEERRPSGKGGGQIGDTQQKKVVRQHRSSKLAGKRRSELGNGGDVFGEPRACTNGPGHQDPLRRLSVEVDDCSDHGSVFTRDTLSFNALQSPTSTSEAFLESKDGSHTTRVERDLEREPDIGTKMNEWPDFFSDDQPVCSKPESAVWIHIRAVLNDGSSWQNPVKERDNVSTVP